MLYRNTTGVVIEICGAGLGFRAEGQILEMKVMEERVHRVTSELRPRG